MAGVVLGSLIVHSQFRGSKYPNMGELGPRYCTYDGFGGRLALGG